MSIFDELSDILEMNGCWIHFKPILFVDKDKSVDLNKYEQRFVFLVGFVQFIKDYFKTEDKSTASGFNFGLGLKEAKDLGCSGTKVYVKNDRDFFRNFSTAMYEDGRIFNLIMTPETVDQWLSEMLVIEETLEICTHLTSITNECI